MVSDKGRRAGEVDVEARNDDCPAALGLVIGGRELFAVQSLLQFFSSPFHPSGIVDCLSSDVVFAFVCEPWREFQSRFSSNI